MYHSKEVSKTSQSDSHKIAFLYQQCDSQIAFSQKSLAMNPNGKILFQIIINMYRGGLVKGHYGSDFNPQTRCLIGSGFFFQHNNNPEQTDNAAQAYLDRCTMEQYQLCSGLPRARTSTLLKPCEDHLDRE